MFRKVFFTLLFLFFFSQTVFASNTDLDTPKLYFFQNSINEKNINSLSFYFFSYGLYENEKNGDIIALFSNIDIDNNIDGEIYSFFSNIKINENGNVKVIRSISSTITFFSNKNINIFSFFRNLFGKENSVNKYTIYTDKIPNISIMIILILIKLFVCFTLLSIKKGFFAQGSKVYIYQGRNILNNGFITYITSILLIILFILSIIGIPISILIFFLFYFFILCGEVSAGISLGEFLSNQLKIKFSLQIKLLIGVFILELFSFTPTFSYLLKITIFPIIYTGIFITTVINVFINKKYYELDFELDDYSRKKPDKNIKDILFK